MCFARYHESVNLSQRPWRARPGLNARRETRANRNNNYTDKKINSNNDNDKITNNNNNDNNTNDAKWKRMNTNLSDCAPDFVVAK